MKKDILEFINSIEFEVDNNEVKEVDFTLLKKIIDEAAIEGAIIVTIFHDISHWRDPSELSVLSIQFYKKRKETDEEFKIRQQKEKDNKEKEDHLLKAIHQQEMARELNLLKRLKQKYPNA